MRNKITSVVILLSVLLSSCGKDSVHEAELEKTLLFSASLNGTPMTASKPLAWQPVSDVVFTLEFSADVDIEKFDPSAIRFSGGDLDVSYGENHSVIELRPKEQLAYFSTYTLSILPVEQLGVNLVESYSYSFVTCY